MLKYIDTYFYEEGKMATQNECDDFWDIDKLVPKKKTTVSPFSSAKRTVTFTMEGEEDFGAEERKLSPDLVKSVPTVTEDASYRNDGAGLVRGVTIRKIADKYDFYGNFRKAALLYYDYKTDKCDFAPFYSYMPQYSQLTTEQKHYYFYWRSQVRMGRYIKSDYSYLYLYAYEILNLPDKISPENGLSILCDIWREYRSTFPRMDSYFALWVQDYCLVYKLPCPTDKIRDFIFAAITASSFKEFYLSDISRSGSEGADAMLAYLSDYDWRKGKYYGGESAQIYSLHMLGAMWRVLYDLELTQNTEAREVAVLRRDAFAHSLCTHAVKCKLEIEYIPLAKDEKIRAVVTGGVRYTENKLRALLGVKSRLAVKDFPDEYKRLVDRYFDTLIEQKTRERVKQSQPEYEKLYDAPREKLSFAGADEIERASWATTLRLVEGSEENVPVAEETLPEMSKDESPSSVVPEEAAASSPEEDTVPDYGLSADDIKELLALYRGERGLDDSVAERINEAFADNFGDVILEYADDGFRIIEDYTEEIGEWLLKITK